MKTRLPYTLLLTAFACSAPSVERADTATSVRAASRTASHSTSRTTSRTARPTVKVRSRPTLARPCRNDSLFIDVPLHLDPAWSDLAFVSPLREMLEQRIATNGQAWFCASANCVGEPVAVEVVPVLKARSELHRSDGHLRFLRVRFRGQESRRVLALADARQCGAVDALRDAVADAAGVPDDTYWVGRECDAQAATLESQPTAEMRTWHLAALGVGPGSATLPAALPSGRVNLALVDSGVVPGVASAVGVASVYDAVGTPGRHEHGSGMAVLTRQLAPQADLHDVRVLEAGGAGTSEVLARGLDQILFSTPASEPLVLNLSLGWPAELSRTAVIQGGGCQSREDPFGEAVRYVLDVARRYDDGGHRRVFISAAAGNRPRDVPVGLFPAAPQGHVEFSCSTPPTGSALFFPGEYARIDTCRPSGPSLRLAHATSGVDAAHRISTTSIELAETPLVAPGQHVMAASPGTASAPVCSTGQSFPPPVSLPAAFTGSSVSAALVSAAAARTQDHLLAARQNPLDQGGLERLLYLTGRDLCRFTAQGDPVRELHVGRLDQIFSDDGCTELVDCARAVGASGADLLSICGRVLIGCGLEEGDANGNLSSACAPPPPVSLGVPAGYQPASCAAVRAGTPAVVEAAACSPTCPDASGRSPDLLGSIGPQPDDGGCPWCIMEWTGPGTTHPAVAVFELNPAFEPGTTITDPWLILKGLSTNNQPKTYFVDLYTVTSPGDWYPGAGMKVQLNLSGMDLDPYSVEASLQTQIMTPNAKYSATDVSPIASSVVP